MDRFLLPTLLLCYTMHACTINTTKFYDIETLKIIQEGKMLTITATLSGIRVPDILKAILVVDVTLIWYLTFPAKWRMTKAGSITGVGTK